MQTRIKKVTEVEGKVKFIPQWKKGLLHGWYGFYIYTGSNDEIVKSSPCKSLSNHVYDLQTAKEVIDKFLKNPVTEEKIEYIKYP